MTKRWQDPEIGKGIIGNRRPAEVDLYYAWQCAEVTQVSVSGTSSRALGRPGVEPHPTSDEHVLPGAKGKALFVEPDVDLRIRIVGAGRTPGVGDCIEGASFP